MSGNERSGAELAPAVSKAVVATAYGGPEVLSMIDVVVPDPGPGQVRIAVRAAGVNPVDHKMYSGAFGTDPAGLPMRLGAEAREPVLGAGRWPDGRGRHRRARSGSDRLAQGRVGPGPRRRGMRRLVRRAAGGGAWRVARGATVLATASPAKHDLLRGLGAVPIAYGPGLAERVRTVAPDGVQAAIDVVGTDEAVDVSVELVADRSRIATIAAFQRGAQAGIKLLGGGPGADPGTAIRAAARLHLTEAAAAGRLRILIAYTYPLHEAATHRQIMTGHTAGKIVLVS
nr:zinc-binding dehydrogenase [Frankia sp. Cas4]